MELAALATAAVPGLSPTGVAAAADDARAFSSAVITDAEGNRWRVRSPQHQEAAMRLETELQVLRGFTAAVRAELPFRVPSVAGAVRRGELRTFVYNHLPGRSLDLDELTAQSEHLADDVGRTIAAIHDLDTAVVDQADLPRYSAERFRQRRLNELDQAATTGQIPASLLRRWEHAMEERELWDFTPVVTHGDLHEDTMLVDGERVVAVTGWTDLHIGDPADDFAWLTAAPDLDFSEAVVEAYGRHRRGEADPHLMRRAALAAEFALATWLVRGKDAGNQEMVEEALELLRQLDDDVEAHGGQPISLTPIDASPDTGVSAATAQEQASEPAAAAGVAAPVATSGPSGRAVSAPTADTPDEPTLAGTDISAQDDVPDEPTDESADESSPDEDTADAEPAAEPAAEGTSEAPTGRIYPVQEDSEGDDEPAVITDASLDERPVIEAEPDETPDPDDAPDPDATPDSDNAPDLDDTLDLDEAPKLDETPDPQTPDPQTPGSAPTESGDEPDDETDLLSDDTTEIQTVSEAPAPSETSDSIYERHPGLRPPGV